MKANRLLPILLFAPIMHSGGAQENQPIAERVTQQPVISGKLEPNRIPEKVAWRVLFFVLADGPAAPSYELRAAHLKKSELSSREKDVVVDAANRFVKELEKVEKRILDSKASMSEKTAQLRFECERLVDSTVAEIDREFGFEAHQKIRKHLDERVKPNIEMTPDN